MQGSIQGDTDMIALQKLSFPSRLLIINCEFWSFALKLTSNDVA